MNDSILIKSVNESVDGYILGILKNKNIILYTTSKPDQELIIQASYYEKENGGLRLTAIESENDWALIDRLLKELIKNA